MLSRILRCHGKAKNWEPNKKIGHAHESEVYGHFSSFLQMVRRIASLDFKRLFCINGHFNMSRWDFLIQTSFGALLIMLVWGFRVLHLIKIYLAICPELTTPHNLLKLPENLKNVARSLLYLEGALLRDKYPSWAALTFGSTCKHLMM